MRKEKTDSISRVREKAKITRIIRVREEEMTVTDFYVVRKNPMFTYAN